MKLNLETDLRQKEIPTTKWLVFDTNKKVIRGQSPDVTDAKNLSVDEEKIMNRLIDFVRYSQDGELNNPDNKDYLRPAVGLAAPQIGANVNMFFARWEWDVENGDVEETAAVNPKILSRSRQMVALQDGEGCLSVKHDHDGVVPRNFKIVVEYYDFLKKKQIKETLRGYKAIVFQHEVDHNHGILYYDHINQKDPHHIDKDWILL